MNDRSKNDRSEDFSPLNFRAIKYFLPFPKTIPGHFFLGEFINKIKHFNMKACFL